MPVYFNLRNERRLVTRRAPVLPLAIGLSGSSVVPQRKTTVASEPNDTNQRERNHGTSSVNISTGQNDLFVCLHRDEWLSAHAGMFVKDYGLKFMYTNCSSFVEHMRRQSGVLSTRICSSLPPLLSFLLCSVCTCFLYGFARTRGAAFKLEVRGVRRRVRGSFVVLKFWLDSLLYFGKRGGEN